MAVPVTRLRPRVHTYEEALDAYRAVRLHWCVGGLQAREDAPSRLLYARVLLRLGRTADAMSVLERISADTHALVAERFALTGAALTRLEAFDDANQALTGARAHAYGASCIDLEAEIEYYQGLVAFARGDLETFAAANHRILSLAEPPGGFGEHFAYPVPIAHTRARAYEALGAVALSRGGYHEQASFSRRALREMDEAPCPDLWIEATNLMNLTVLAGKLDLFEHVAYISERLTAMAWTDELANRRFAALDAFGWHLALRGDNIGAFRQFRMAAAVAKSTPERVRASVSRAYLSYELGHEPVAIEELEHALELAGDYDWSVGDRTALLYLAEAAATIAPHAARGALERYRAIRASHSTLSLSRVEPALAVGEDFAEGLLARAEGRTLKAIAYFQRAHDGWTAAGIEWRAARAAIELAELGAGAPFAREAHREAVKRPTSWIARRVAALPAPAAAD